MSRKRDRAAFMISAVSEQYDIHPQTLRLYEREGLLRPSRTEGNTRLYTEKDLERLEIILSLTRDLGVNLAGVEIILNMREKMEVMQGQMAEFVACLSQQMRQLQAAPQPLDASKRALVPLRSRSKQ
jgi:MerR family transcriptional regulator/heat shock protein HspR